MQEILKKTYSLTASDVDCHGLCRTSALLQYLQNMATEHAIILELDGERMMAEHNAVWMMVRLNLTLDRPIRWPEAFVIHTYHRGVTERTAIVFRDFDIFVGEERVGEATASWVLADIQDRKILKPGHIPFLLTSPRPAEVKACVPAKIKAPREMVQEMVRTVTYSDTDINGHMNNTKYVDIACDAMRYDRCKDQFISEVQVNYVQECFPGDEIIVLQGEADGTHYVRGTDAEGHVRFEVCMTLDGL